MALPVHLPPLAMTDEKERERERDTECVCV